MSRPGQLLRQCLHRKLLEQSQIRGVYHQRFVSFADSLHPSPQAKFVMGLITYQIGEHALLAAWQIHNCSVVLLASDALVKSDRYLAQNSVVAPQNAIKLRDSIVLMRKDATELVNRRCL